jgi:hypothetical protein
VLVAIADHVCDEEIEEGVLVVVDEQLWYFVTIGGR